MSKKFKKLNREVIKTNFHQSYYWLNGVLSNGNDKDIIQLILSFQSNGKVFYMQTEQIAKMLHRSESTISHRIGLLKKQGYIINDTKSVKGKGERGGKIRNIVVNEDKMIGDYIKKYGDHKKSEMSGRHDSEDSMVSTEPLTKAESTPNAIDTKELILQEQPNLIKEESNHNKIEMSKYVMGFANKDYEKSGFQEILDEVIPYTGKEFLTVKQLMCTLDKMLEHYKSQQNKYPRKGIFRSKVDDIEKLIKRIISFETKAA